VSTCAASFEKMPLAMCDRAKLTQILVNLIANAEESLAQTAATERHLTLHTKTNGNGNVEIHVSTMAVASRRKFAIGFSPRFYDKKSRPWASACTRVRLPLKRWEGRSAPTTTPQILAQPLSWSFRWRVASHPFLSRHDTDTDTIYRILIVDDNPAIHDDFRKILSSRSAATKQLGAAAAKLFGRPSRQTDALRFEIDCVSRGQEGLDKVRAAACEGRPYSMAYVDVAYAKRLGRHRNDLPHLQEHPICWS